MLKLVTPKDVMAHLRCDVYVRAQPSRISGVGVFAIRDIPKGIDPFQQKEFGPKFVWVDESDVFDDPKIPSSVKEYARDLCVRKNGKLRVPRTGFNGAGPRTYVNHSNNPNLRVDADGYFQTTRLIRKGEELSSNYFTYSEEPELAAQLRQQMVAAE